MSGLDKGSLENASAVLNSTLLAKGYLKKHEKLVFPSVALNDLIDVEEESSASGTESRLTVSATAKCMENDKTTMNLIYLLVQTIERNSKQKEAFLEQLNQEKNRAAAAQEEKRVLQNKLMVLEKKSQEQSLAKVSLLNTIRSLEVKQAELRESNAKISAAAASMKTQLTNEIRRKEIELSQARERLFTLNRRKPGALDDVPLLDPVSVKTAVIDRETQVILSDLNVLVQHLAKEHQRLSALINAVSEALATISANPKTNEIADIRLEELIRRQEASGTSNEDISVQILNLKPYDVLLSQAEDALQGLTALLMHTTGSYGDTEGSGDQQFENLQQENQELKAQLEKVTANWKNAIDTMEKWKAYRESR